MRLATRAGYELTKLDSKTQKAQTPCKRPGRQFTSPEFTSALHERGNVFVERLWRSIKHDEVYLHADESVSQAKAGIGRYIEFYNTHRPHSMLDKRMPDEFYFALLAPLAKAA